MSTTLPHPHRSSLAVPLAALALGLAGGISGGLILADDDPVEFRSPAPAKVALPSSAPPVPERVTSDAPTSSLAGTSGSTAPVPERVAGATAGKSLPSYPTPERISGARAE